MARKTAGSDKPRDRSDQRTVIFNTRKELPPPEAMSALASDPLPGALRLVIRKEAGPGAPLSVTLASAAVMIGRAEGVAEILVDDEKVSRYHAGIAYCDGKFLLVDLGSANGTLLNGALVGRAEIRDGDRIEVGDTVLSFSLSQGLR